MMRIDLCMESAKLIRSYGRSFARMNINETELRNKIEKMYEEGLTHIPQHGMAFKGGLGDANCGAERKEMAINILTDIDPEFNKTSWLNDKDPFE